MVVHCRIDQEKIPLRPSLQERKNHTKLPRGKRTGLQDGGVGSKPPHPTPAAHRILGNFPVSKSTPLKCHFPVKSLSRKGSFQISRFHFIAWDHQDMSYFMQI